MSAKLTVYIPDDMDEQLRQLADERGQSLSTLVTRLLQAALAKPAKAKEPAR
jgi:predicted HicB family RNase H-like nuclease